MQLDLFGSASSARQNCGFGVASRGGLLRQKREGKGSIAQCLIACLDGPLLGGLGLARVLTSASRACRLGLMRSPEPDESATTRHDGSRNQARQRLRSGVRRARGAARFGC